MFDSDPLGLVATLNGRGFTFVTCDCGGKETWGAAVATRDYSRVIASLPHKSVLLLAASMGGLTAVHPIPLVHPAAVALLYPVCEPRYFGEPVMGLATLHWHGAIPPGPRVPVMGLRVLLFASPEDTIVPKVHNANVCAAWMRRGGADVTEVPATGQHADPSNLRPDWLADVFSRNLDDSWSRPHGRSPLHPYRVILRLSLSLEAGEGARRHQAGRKPRFAHLHRGDGAGTSRKAGSETGTPERPRWQPGRSIRGDRSARRDRSHSAILLSGERAPVSHGTGVRHVDSALRPDCT